MNIKQLIKEAHENAVDKGFYECPECGGIGYELETLHHVPECTKCKGTGKDPNKNIGELLMLIVSELGEALEAHKNGRYYFYDKLPNVIKPEKEQWKPIPLLDYEYEASNMGRIRSNDLEVWNGKVNYIKKGKVLKPGKIKSGYFTVAPRGKTYKVSILVSNAFFGDRRGKVINHINGDKTCDWITNLEYVTSSENNIHAIKTGLTSRQKILTFDDKLQISFRFKNGDAAPEIHKDYPQVSLSAIKNIRQKGIDKYTECFEMEIADVFIRLFDLCGYLGVSNLNYISELVFKLTDNLPENFFKLIREFIILYNVELDSDGLKQYSFSSFYTKLMRVVKLYNIDIEKHIKAKMAYNKTRPYKHGKEY